MMTPVNPNLVLLFYDGYELQAEEPAWRYVKAQARRAARYLWNNLRRRQVWSGRYMTYRSLRKALTAAGCDVRVNDFQAARRYPEHPIAVTGYITVLDKVEGLPNPRVVGSGILDTPLQRPHLFDDPRNCTFVLRAEWERTMFAPYFGDRLRMWYRGYDLDEYEDVSKAQKSVDVLIYDKIYHARDYHFPRTIGRLTEMLRHQGLSFEIIQYGRYHPDHYISALRRCRSMAFFAHSEIQGNAQLQASAMNMPIFAWDEGVWLDPLARQLSDQPIASSSVTHFDDRCGLQFKMADMEQRWLEFWAAREHYNPRAYVGEELSLAGSAALYLSHYREAARMRASAQTGVASLTERYA
ncbi:MAG: hypothetical protein K2P58_04195 [Hyphomonadaceae bacterium]|nr:hypothetical protein [Hyphomonadaceae bacterium]